MASNSTPDVLIAGAGPTGLTLALDLAQAGVPFRIVDKNAERSKHSKALGMQAGTLECLGAVFGEDFAQEFIAAGRPCSAAFLHFYERAPVRLDLSAIESRFNFILIIPQSETERILEKKLEEYGVKVERETELVSIAGDQDPVCVLKSSNGSTEEIRPRFVAGCDGAHSVVRHQLKLDFDGGAYEGNFLLADAEIDWEWSYDSVRVFLTEKGVAACFPFKGDRLYRIVFVRPAGAETDPSLDVVGLNLFMQGEIGLNRLKVSKLHWLSPFRIHHRIVSRFQLGRIFLAGDSAHIHSPVGGQGMNIGMQEALSLGGRLRMALDEGSFDVLNDYEDVRKPIAKKVVRNTDFVFRLWLMQDGLVTRTLRRHFAAPVIGSRWLQKRVLHEISEVELAAKLIAFRQSLS